MDAGRIVLDERVNQEEFEALAKTKGWTLERTILESYQPPRPYERIWLTADGHTHISYVDDWMINRRYLEVAGEDFEDTYTFITAILPTITRDKLPQRLKSVISKESWIALLYLVAILSPVNFDPELYIYYSAGFVHFEPEVRCAAVFATAYAPWHQFEEVLERLAVEDSDPTVRDYAAQVLDRHRIQTWN